MKFDLEKKFGIKFQTIKWKSNFTIKINTTYLTLAKLG